MPLTRSVNATLRERATRIPLRAALFGDAVQALLAGDPDTAKAALRAYINATVGFEKLGAAAGTPIEILMRMLGPGGNRNRSQSLQGHPRIAEEDPRASRNPRLGGVSLVATRRENLALAEI